VGNPENVAGAASGPGENLARERDSWLVVRQSVTPLQATRRLVVNRSGRIIGHIVGLVDLFRSSCSDGETLSEIRSLAAERSKWSQGHALFDRIRRKSLRAQHAGNRTDAAQYAFEEMCAKTIYNLSQAPAPFDPDSPYWILPDALALARALGISDRDVLAIVVASEGA